MSIGEKIKDLRIKNKLTQAQLAEKLFVSRQAITNYERNANRPDIEILKKLSEIFDVNVEYFFDDEIEQIDETNEVEKENIVNKKYNRIIIIATIVAIFTICFFVVNAFSLSGKKKNRYISAGWYIEFNSDYVYTIDELLKSDLPYILRVYDKDEKMVDYHSQFVGDSKDLFFSNQYESIYIFSINYYPYYDKYEISLAQYYTDHGLCQGFCGNFCERNINILPPVSEVNIITYDKYNNIILDDKVYLDIDGIVKSTNGQYYPNGFHSYMVFGAARYYVEYIDNDGRVNKYNIIEPTIINIFITDGDYHKNDYYCVIFDF